MDDDRPDAPAASPLDRRPRGYWDVPEVVRTIANVKGTRRKEVAMEHLLDGRLALLDPRLLAESLEGELRAEWTAVHPSFHGGEALPDALPGEVEIARVVLQADPDARGEAISVRACPAEGDAIALRVVDEYGRAYALPSDESDRPLSLRELVAVLDGARRADLGDGGIGLIDRFREGRLSDGERVDRVLGFVRTISLYYPALAAHLADRADDWLQGLSRRWTRTYRVEGIARPAPALAVLGGGRSLAIGSGEHLLIADTEGDAPLVAVAAHEGPLTALAHVGAGERELLVTGGGDGRVRVWRADGTAQAVMGDDGGGAPVVALAASATTSVVAVGRGDEAEHPLDLWDLETGDALGALPTEGATLALAFLRGGQALAAADAKGLRLWDVPHAAVRLALPEPADALAPAPRGAWLVLAAGGALRVLDAASGRLLRERPPAAAEATDRLLARSAVVALADGRTVAVADGATIALYDLVAGRDAEVIGELPGPPLALAAAPGAYALAASFADGTAWLWHQVVDVPAGDERALDEPAIA